MFDAKRYQSIFLAFILLGVSAPLTAEVMSNMNRKLQDPTRPLDFATPRATRGEISVTRSSMVVESVLISPSRRVVVINGRTLAEGDFLDGVEITEIDEHGIGVKKDGRVLFLKPGKVLTVKRQS